MYRVNSKFLKGFVYKTESDRIIEFLKEFCFSSISYFYIKSYLKARSIVSAKGKIPVPPESIMTLIVFPF